MNDNYFINNLDKYLNEDDMVKEDDLAVNIYEKSTNRPILSPKDRDRMKVSSRRKQKRIKTRNRLNTVKDITGMELPKKVVAEHQIPIAEYSRWPNVWDESTANHRRTIAAKQHLRETENEI